MKLCLCPSKSVTTKPVVVVGILKAGYYLVYPLAEHLGLVVLL